MRVIGYTRVSTDEQAGRGVSLAAQAQKLRAYADLYELELVDVVEDGGYSAKTLSRPGLQRALEMLRAGAVDGLLVAKLDRLTRSVADMATLIDDYFGDRAAAGAALLSVADQVDTRTAAGRLVLNILASVSQWEREAISERTRTALQYKKEQGVRLGRPRLGPDADDAAVVSRLNEMCQLELTLQSMANNLEAEGYKTKRGGRWAPETVRKIIARQAGA